MTHIRLAALLLALAACGPASAHLKMGKDEPTALKTRLADTPAGTMYYSGYSHVDFNWLWDWPDTIHTWDSTARTALNLMYRFPDYHFGQTQAAAYLSMERIRPDIFEDIKSRVADGSWSLLGGMWDESDTNIPSGEGLARCFLYGQHYFQEKFGKKSVVGFLPDTFGHSRQMPQIMKLSGIDYFYFERCPRPKDLFWWQAPDGSRLLAYSSPGWYNASVSASQATWPNTILAASGVNRALCIFGVGNHGGGPTIQDLTTLEALKKDPSFPTIKEGGPEQFFRDCLADRTDFPVYDEELQYTFEGCYTSHGDIKRLIRDSETELTVAETLASIAGMHGLDYPAEDLRFGWRHSAFNQFHDIAPGTAIHSTYEEAANKQKLFKQINEKVITNSWAHLEKRIDTQVQGIPLAVYNPVSWARTDAVEATVAFDGDPLHIRLTAPDGTDVPTQILAKEWRGGKSYVTFVFVAENMPATGYRVYSASTSSEAPVVAGPLTVSDGVVETGRFTVRVDSATGQVSRLFDKSANREVLPAGQRAFRFQVLGEHADNSSWTIRLNGQNVYLDAPTSVETLETGPVRARFRATYKHLTSTYTQDILVYRNVNRVDARMTADFRDYDVMLKSVVPAGLSNTTATFDIPYGALQRAADGKVDVPMQKWMDVSQGSIYGLSVLNDSKYGADVNGATMRQSLLRGTHDPDTTGDVGFHRFALALYPHAGNWKTAGTMLRGYEFNMPLRVMPASKHEGEWGREKSFFRSSLSNVAVTALKRAEDGNGYVARFYEFEGSSRSGSLTLPVTVAGASTVNILEEPMPGSIPVSGNQVFIQSRPYQITSVRFTP